MPLADLVRKRNQAYELAGFARIDNDDADEACRLKEAAMYDAEIRRRAGQGSSK